MPTSITNAYSNCGGSSFQVDFDLTQDEERFRDEVREFNAQHLPSTEERRKLGPGFLVEWWRLIREQRWVGFNWPKDCGGGGGTIMEQYVLKQEMLAANAPALGRDYTGLGWVGPAIIQFGNDEQKERYLPDILDSKTAWCTGYSEPNIGKRPGRVAMSSRTRWRRIRRERPEDLDLPRACGYWYLHHGANPARRAKA